jgi:hypothetical protein
VPGWRVLGITTQVAFGMCVRFLSHGLPFHEAHSFSVSEDKANIKQGAGFVLS